MYMLFLKFTKIISVSIKSCLLLNVYFSQQMELTKRTGLEEINYFIQSGPFYIKFFLLVFIFQRSKNLKRKSRSYFILQKCNTTNGIRSTYMLLFPLTIYFITVVKEILDISDIKIHSF